MKRILITAWVIIMGLAGLPCNQAAALEDYCQPVYDHMSAMTGCATESCIDFEATLTTVSGGGGTHCRLEADTGDWYESRLDEKFDGVEGDDVTHFVSAFGDDHDLSFTYNISDSAAFISYDYLQISYRLRFGFGRGDKKINFTRINFIRASDGAAGSDDPLADASDDAGDTSSTDETTTGGAPPPLVPPGTTLPLDTGPADDLPPPPPPPSDGAVLFSDSGCSLLGGAEGSFGGLVLSVMFALTLLPIAIRRK